MKLLPPFRFSFCWIMVSLVISGFTSLGRAVETNVPPPKTALDFYNAGTRLLAAGKFTEAEPLFLSALNEQDERIQPQALYNLGHARFAGGLELLKKGPDAQKVSAQGSRAMAAADNATTVSQTAMAQNDMDKMIGAYIAGRGVRRELRAAEKAVKDAMEIYGNTLRKWQRASDDFKSAMELNPADTNAARNAEMVQEGVAQLVDSVRKMQAMAAALARNKQELDKILGQLKGQIPAPNAPPGTPGDEDEDDEGILPDALTGQKEGPSREGEQRKIPLSPDQAGQILDSLSPDGTRRLPMSDQQTSKPKDKTGRNW